MNNTMNRRKVFRSLLCPDGIAAACASTYVHNEYLTEYKLCSFNNALLTYGQLEACRKVITRIVKRQKPKGFFIQIGKVYMPFTQKSKNARMGRGKGIVQGQVFCANVFSTLFMLRNVSSACAARAATQIQKKLNINICVVNMNIPRKSRNLVSDSNVCFNNTVRILA